MFERRKANKRNSKWDSKEEALLMNHLKKDKFSISKLEKLLPKRSKAAIRSKTRKLRIKHDLFGESYREDKMDFTNEYAIKLKPKSIFEAYCGAGHQTKVWSQNCNQIFSSDKAKIKKKQFIGTLIDEKFIKLNSSSDWTHLNKKDKNIYFFSGDAIDAAIDLRNNNIDIELLDLDTCGSTLPTLPILLNILKPKYLVITHGEFHSMRFGRDDVLRRVLFHRDISKSQLNLSVDELASELDKAVKVAALRINNETKDSLWAELIDETWLGTKFHGMLRRIYRLKKARATADHLNELIY